MAMNCVTIVGVGLIGGSFARALRTNGFSGEILGVSSRRTLELALEHGVIDRAASLEEAVPKSDLVYLSQPISRILELLPEVRKLARCDALVTDAGSTKRAIVEEAAPLFNGHPCFLGGHPMAGKAGRGVELADAALFQGRTYVLTPSDGRLPSAPLVDEFVRWLERIGAQPLVLPPELHDQIVAWTSHLPQLASTALAACAFNNMEGEHQFQVAGPGLRDMTRLAESPYAIWKDILSTNRENLESALSGYIRQLEHFRESLCATSLEEDFHRAQRFRKKLSNQRRA